MCCVSRLPALPQTREQLQAEIHRSQAQIEDLEKALAEQGQVTARQSRPGPGALPSPVPAALRCRSAVPIDNV